MPIIKKYGDTLPVGGVGPCQVPQMPCSRAAAPPIQADRWARNGKHPNAQLVNALDELANQGSLFRGKQVFTWYGRAVGGVFPHGTSGENRWRWAFHTGPYTHALVGVVMLVPPPSLVVPVTTSGRAYCSILDMAGVSVNFQTFEYGPNPVDPADPYWSHFTPFVKYIDGIDPDTSYQGVFSSEAAMIQSACVFELGSLTEHNDGYLPQNLTAQTSLIETFRSNLIDVNNNLWLCGGAQVLNWNSDNHDTYIYTISATPTNIVDGTSTAVSVATPGFTLDMTGKARENQPTGVPCKFKAYGVNDGVAVGVQPALQLVNSAGTTVATIGFSTSLTWQEVDVVLPATVDKYDLLYNGNPVNGLKLYAVSIYEIG